METHPSRLKKTLILAIALASVCTISWEMYWRTKPAYYRAYLEDGKYMWADQRARLEDAGPDDVVLIGASRSGYNFNVKTWQETQGVKPINLSANGKCAGPFLEDIVLNTGFNGTIVISVTPVAWFEEKDTEGWNISKAWVDHYYDETFAQRFNYLLSKPLQRNLVFLSKADCYNDLTLEAIINRIPLKGRGGWEFKLTNFGYNDEDRTLIMMDSFAMNPAYAKEITDAWDDIWTHFLHEDMGFEMHPENIIPYHVELIDKFRARGGRVILVQHKAEPDWIGYSSRLITREQGWDQLIEATGCPGYHFEDHPFMGRYTLPEWSHMKKEDAVDYTRAMVNRMIDDGFLKRIK